MIRDFEQIVGDTRFWLRHTSKPKLTRKNFAKQFGRSRQSFEILPLPTQCITGFELTSAIGDRCIAGAIQVQSMTGQGPAELTELAWDEENMAIRSLMTGSESIHLLSDLPGVVLDRVHTQLAVPLQQVLRNIQPD